MNDSEASTNKFYDAFISYGREDSKAFALKLKENLASLDFKVWFDFDNIPAGVNYPKQIGDGIDKADNFLLILSPRSVNSRECREEIERAIERNKRIIPLLHVEQISRETWQQRYPNGTEAGWQEYQKQGLHSIFPNMHPIISKINWVNFGEDINNFATALDKLRKIFERDRDYVRQHTTLLSRALEWERHHKQTEYLLGEERIKAEAWLKQRFKNEQPPCEPTDLHCEFICESIKNVNKTTQVFLSHAEADREETKKIHKILLRKGITVWTNKTDIQTGEKFPDAINQGIEQADNLVYLISPAALQSKYCRQEIEHALRLRKRIIPLLIRPTDLEEVSELGTLQWIDFTDNKDDADYRQDIDKLLKALQEDAAYVHSHTKWLQKSLEWKEKGHSKGWLLQESEFAIAKAWLEETEQSQKQPFPTDLQREFIQCSSEAIRDREKKKKQLDVLLKSLLALMSTAFVGAAVFGMVAVKERNRAEMALRDQAKTLAQQSLALTESESDREFDALVQVMRADRLLRQQHLKPEPETQAQLIPAMQEALYRMKELSRLEGHAKDVHNLAVSPDGQIIATASADKTVRLWTPAGRLIKILQHDDEAWDVRFSPDSQTIATWSRDNTVKLWTRTGELIKTLQLDSEVWGVAFSPDNQRIVTWSSNKQVKLWTFTGELIKTLSFGGKVEGVSLSPDGQRFATRLNDGTIDFWNYQGKKLATLKQPELRAAWFSPNSQMLTTRNDKGIVKLWSLNGQELTTLPHPQQVSALEFSPDSQILATGGQDGLVRLWRVDGHLLRTLKHNDEVKSVRFSSNGQTLITASRDGTAKLWNVDDGAELETWQHEDEVKEATFVPHSSLIVTRSGRKTIKVWDLKNPYLTLLQGHTGAVGRVIFSPDGRMIATTSSDKTAKLWHRDGTQIATLKGHQDDIREMSFSPDSQMIVTTSDDKTVKLWSVQGKLIHTFQTGGIAIRLSFNPDNQTIAVATPGRDNSAVQLFAINGERIKTLPDQWSTFFSPDGQILATGQYKQVHLWTRDGTFLRTLDGGHQDIIKDISFSPDSQTLAVASSDKTVQLWNLKGEKLQTLRGHTDKVRQVRFSPDGETIATVSEDGTAKLWNLKGEVLQTLEGHTDKVFQVRFSSDGTMIATASDDQTIKLWTLQGNLLQTLRSTAGIYSIDFSPDGQLIAVASDQNVGTIWNLDLENLQVDQTGYLDYLTRQSCTWVSEYLNNQPVGESDHYLCDGIRETPGLHP